MNIKFIGAKLVITELLTFKLQNKQHKVDWNHVNSKENATYKHQKNVQDILCLPLKLCNLVIISKQPKDAPDCES